MCIGGGRGGMFCIRRALSPSYIYLGGGDLSVASSIYCLPLEGVPVGGGWICF